MWRKIHQLRSIFDMIINSCCPYFHTYNERILIKFGNYYFNDFFFSKLIRTHSENRLILVLVWLLHKKFLVILYSFAVEQENLETYRMKSKNLVFPKKSCTFTARSRIELVTYHIKVPCPIPKMTNIMKPSLHVCVTKGGWKMGLVCDHINSTILKNPFASLKWFSTLSTLMLFTG